MNIALSAPENKKKQSRKIPDYLVYEVLNGKKLYRKVYKDVLNQTKTLEEIMGSSSLQGIIISLTDVTQPFKKMSKSANFAKWSRN